MKRVSCDYVVIRLCGYTVMWLCGLGIDTQIVNCELLIMNCALPSVLLFVVSAEVGVDDGFYDVRVVAVVVVEVEEEDAKVGVVF